MAISIGINGFGRIGRVALRIAISRPETFKLCGINARNADLDYMVYMIRYDSTFGRFQGELGTYEHGLIINGQKIPVFTEGDAASIPWGSCGAEYIIDATGAFCRPFCPRQRFIPMTTRPNRRSFFSKRPAVRFWFSVRGLGRGNSKKNW